MSKKSILFRKIDAVSRETGGEVSEENIFMKNLPQEVLRALTNTSTTSTIGCEGIIAPSALLWKQL